MSVQTAIRPCTTFTTTNLSTLYPNGSLCKFLTKNTTKEEFALIAKNIKEAGLSLSDDGDERGISVVHRAAFVNHTVFRTISNEYIRAPELLTLRGMANGFLPLHAAVYCNQIETVYALISLGSPINPTVTIGNDVGDVPEGATPLDIAILRVNPRTMISVLKLSGGKSNLSLKHDGVDTFIDTVESAAMRTLKSIAEFFSKEYHCDFLNKDVFTILVGYLVDYENLACFKLRPHWGLAYLPVFEETREKSVALL